MFDGTDPIYLQIAEHLRREILTGNLRESEQVMSTTQFATTYRINPATAAKAFALLVDEGILYKQRGVGMFVAPGAPDTLRAGRRAAFFAEHLDPLLGEADVLGITPRELIDHIANVTTKGDR